MINIMHEVLAQIAFCETVLSLPLHGLIIADAFRIPNQWCRFRPVVDENAVFKYQDYYSFYQLETYPFYLWQGGFLSVQDIKGKYQVTNSMIEDKIELLQKSFPGL